MSELKQRKDVEAKFKWNIEDLVSSDSEFEKQLVEVRKEFDEISKYKGKISTENLYDVLKLRDKIHEKTMKLYVYSKLKHYEDSTNSTYQALASKTDTLASEQGSTMSFINPEILALDENKLTEALEKDGLNLYKQNINNLLRNKPHTLSAGEEAILAQASEVTSAGSSAFSMINNADATFGKIKDEHGNDVTLTNGNYISFMQSEDRDVREQAFKTMFKYYNGLKNTIASTYTSSAKTDIFNAKVRKFNSSIEQKLFNTNVSVDVYKNLIDTVHKNLPAMHDYIELRKKRLDVEEVHFYDLYAPIVSDVNWKVDFEEAKLILLEALKPLGEDYIENLKKSFDSGWIDIYENVGKRSGAYVWGAFGCHPFVSLNYSNTIDSLFTFAHEMGHAMHSHYSGSTQKSVYAGYTIFLAEVASTVNEALLMDYLLKTTEDKSKKAYLINYYMEQFRGTLFRQTMFAEFEMIVHEKMENGNPQTFDSLCDIYKELNLKYYGKKIVLDKEISWEWARIPHFYTAFYVYQYATGYSAAISFAERILNESEEDGLIPYLNFLKSGSCDYSTEILKKAGVDMTKKEPIEKALKVFEGLVKQMSEL